MCYIESMGFIFFLVFEILVFCLQGFILFFGCEKIFENKCVGVMYFDVCFRIFVVCENRGSKYVCVLKF